MLKLMSILFLACNRMIDLKFEYEYKFMLKLLIF